MQEESFATTQGTTTMVQQLEELTASISTIDTPIFNMQECRLEEPTRQVMKDMVRFDDDSYLHDLNNQDLKCNASREKSPWEFKPKEEIEPQYEKQVTFEVVLSQALTKLDSQLINIGPHLLDKEMSIQNHKMYEDQISSMVMDSQVESEEQCMSILVTMSTSYVG